MTLRFGVDPRALAVLRVLLGLFILVDLLYRVPHMGAFLTDAGVLPRSALSGFWRGHALYSLFGSSAMQGVVLIAHALVTLALLVGYRTRWATVLSFVLLLSLHWRNPFVLNAGDLLVRVLLFWGMFLPLGARWSFDALRTGTPRTPIADVATSGLLVQVVVIYVLNAYHKIHGGIWTSGEALQYVFQTERYLTSLGLALGGHPDLLAGLGRSWLGLLLLAPLLLITTGRVRILLVGLFAGAHASMFILMQLGFFPLVSLAALLPFLPCQAWDHMEHRIVRPVARTAVTAQWLQRLSRVGHASPPWGGPGSGVAASWVGGARTLGASLLLGWVLLSASLAAGFHVVPEHIEGELEPYGHRWAMFASPHQQNTWLVVPAVLESGRTVDALHLGPVAWDQRYVDEPFPDFRWRKYLDSIDRPGREEMRAAFALFLCERWNDANEDTMTDLVIYRVDEPLHLDGTESAPVEHRLGTYACG